MTDEENDRKISSDEFRRQYENKVQVRQVQVKQKSAADYYLDAIREGGISPEEAVKRAMEQPNLGTTKRAWRDADDFDREVGEGYKVDIEDNINSDMVIVRVRANGQEYRMSSTDAALRGLCRSGDSANKPKVIGVDPAEPQVRTHIMDQGSPMCRFTNKRPVDWPSYNEWVSLDHVKSHVSAENGVTCMDCYRVFINQQKP